GAAPPPGGLHRAGVERRGNPASRARPGINVVDVTVPIRDAMMVYRGNPPVRIRPAMTLGTDGVNLSELCLGSHTGTHIDAPSHFIKCVKGIDRVDLQRFIGPAWVADLRGVQSGICAPELQRSRIPRGTRRLLLRTTHSGWFHHAPPFR